MKTIANIRTLLLTVFLFAVAFAAGQKSIPSLESLKDSGQYIVVKTTEGSNYAGRIKFFRNDTLVIIGDFGELRIPSHLIKKVDPVENYQIRDGKYRFPTPLPGRYLFAPSAFSLKKGEGYYQNTMVVLNSFNVGVTDWMSVGGGIELISTFVSISEGEFRPTFFVTPKVAFKVAPNLRIGGGFLYAQIAGDEVRLGTFYGVTTVGNADNNLTVGLGWGFTANEEYDATFSSKPMITLCGTARMSRRLAFVTENWFIPGEYDGKSYYPLYSYGLRIMGESTSFDLAFLNNRDIVKAIFIGIPFVSFTVKF